MAVISLLIWIYADLHFTETEQVKARVIIHAADSDHGMVILGQTEMTVVFSVKGNKHAIDQLPGRMSYDAGKELGVGIHRDVDVREILEAIDELSGAGIEILGVDEPKIIDITVEETRVFRNVRVEPDYVNGAPESTAEVVPATVDLYVPVGQGAHLGNRPLKASVDLAGKAPGERVDRHFKVQPPPGVVGAIIRPPSVKISLTVGQQLTRRTFNVPLTVQSPIAWLSDETWNKYKLEVKGPELTTNEITIRGNRIDVEKLRLGDIRAYITLNETDKSDVLSWLPGQVRVQFAEGRDYKVENLEVVSPPKVEYRLVKRSAAGPPG